MDSATFRVLLETQIGLIRNKDLREKVREVVSKLPEAFWKREASKIYHPPDERSEGGNLLHTLRVIKVADRMMDATSYNSLARDVMRAGAILHDCLRHGKDGMARVTVNDHPQLAKELIESTLGDVLGKDILLEIVEKHMGRFNTPSYPTSDTPLSDILHIADYLASQLDIEVKI